MTTPQPNLKEIVQRALKNTPRDVKSMPMPPLRAGLDQIARGTSDLLKRSMQESDLSTEKTMAATGMLARQNFDATMLQRSLNNISFKAAVEPLGLTGVTDVQTYLQDEYQRLITIVISEAENNAISAFHDNYARRMQEDWRRDRNSIVEELDIRNTASNEAPVIRTVPGDKQAKYGQAVEKYMKSVRPGNDNALKDFLNDCQNIPGDVELKQCWEVLSHWAEKSNTAMKSNQSEFIKTAIATLQADYAKAVYDKNGADSLTITGLAPCFVGFDGPDWGILYTLIRAGEGVDQWGRVLEDSETMRLASDGRIEKAKELRDFYAGKTGDNRVQSRIIQENDMAWMLHNILTGNPIIDEYYDQNYIRSAQDYLWMVLLPLRNARSEEITTNQYVNDIASAKNPSAFQALLFSGQFDRAISLLVGTEYFTDAVHFVMALSALNLLPSGGPESALGGQQGTESYDRNKQNKPTILVQQYLRSVGFARHITDPYMIYVYRLNKDVFKGLLEEYAMHAPSVKDIRSLVNPRDERWRNMGEGKSIEASILNEVSEKLGKRFKETGHADVALQVFDMAKEDNYRSKLIAMVESLQFNLLSGTGAMSADRIDLLPGDSLVMAAFEVKNNPPVERMDVYEQLKHVCQCVEIFYYYSIAARQTDVGRKRVNLELAYKGLSQQNVIPKPGAMSIDLEIKGARSIVSNPELDEWLIMMAMRITVELCAKDVDPNRFSEYRQYSQILFQASGFMNLTSNAQADILDLFHRITAVNDNIGVPRTEFGGWTRSV